AFPYILRKSLKSVHRPLHDLTGRRFGKWVVLPRDGFESHYRDCQWLVQCECGRLRHIAGQELLNGRSSSCGCTSRRKNGNGKTSGHRMARRTRLEGVMNELRPEGTGPLSQAAPLSGLMDEHTESDFWFD